LGSGTGFSVVDSNIPLLVAVSAARAGTNDDVLNVKFDATGLTSADWFSQSTLDPVPLPAADIVIPPALLVIVMPGPACNCPADGGFPVEPISS